MGWIDGQDSDLVPGQCRLKLGQFGESAGTFGNTCQTVEFFGLSFLDQVSILEIFVVSISGIPVSVCQGLYGDEGSGAAEVVFVFDGDT